MLIMASEIASHLRWQDVFICFSPSPSVRALSYGLCTGSDTLCYYIRKHDSVAKCVGQLLLQY
jgi:hypothetical protein